jgi:AcrR family transcriptional regulator
MTYEASRQQHARHAEQRQLDPRAIRTRALLRDAFVSLILERGYDAITIQDIADRAGLRRATFYLHYKDKEELLTAIMDAMMDDITSEILQIEDNPFDPECNETVIRMVFEHARQNANLYRIILQGHGAIRIVRHVREYMATQIRIQHADDLQAGNSEFPVDVVANYMAASELSLLIWWLENDMPYPPEQMARMCSQLMLKGLGQFHVPA